MVLKRMSYRLGRSYVCGRSRSYVFLYQPRAESESWQAGRHENPDISPELAAFFFLYGFCGNCGAPIARDLAACSCGWAQPPKHLWAAFPSERLEEFRVMFRRESMRAYSRTRANRKRLNGGSHTPVDIADLHRIQGGRCYYCACDLGDEDAPPHVDHYIALVNGGRDDVANLVLTCRACNMDKRAEDGDTYDRQIKPNTKDPVERAILEIRKARQDYLAGLTK